MQRREFVQRASLAGGGLVLGLNRPAALANQFDTNSSISYARDPVQTLLPDAPQPINETERAQRREKAQRLMKQLGYAAMLIEPGANMTYFAGIDWGRSERLFAFILPVTGKGIVIAPAFEQQRAEDQVSGRFEIRVWQEDQNPEALVANLVKEWNASTGRIAIDPSARSFVFTELALARLGMQFSNAALIINQCRGVKSAHEIEIMRFANEITLQAYRAGFKTMRVGITQAKLARNFATEITKTFTATSRT